MIAPPVNPNQKDQNGTQTNAFDVKNLSFNFNKNENKKY